jgi:FMN reductase
MTILTIAGSPQSQSRSARLLEFAADRLLERGNEVDQLRIRELPAEALLQREHRHPVLQRSVARVARASGIVVATPVYNAAYSGLLKAFLDLLPPGALEDKVILPIATAGGAAHGLALDYALKPVLSALGARYVLGGIYALDHQVNWSPETGLQLDAEIAYRLEESLQRMAEAVGPLLPSADAGSVPPPLPADFDSEFARCWD